MAMYWADYVSALGGYLPEQVTHPNQANPFIAGSRYNTILPRCIEYAELRMYRDPDLDFLAAYVTDGSAMTQCTIGTRALAIPSSMVVIDTCNLITPAGINPTGATAVRTPLNPVSVAFLNAAWPTLAFQQAPEHYARNDQNNILLGATPDQQYFVEFYGTVRPTPLSNSNTSTFLTLNLPDLFIAASMVFMSGYQKTFGAMSGDPQQGMTWEQYYGELKSGAAAEEMRKKHKPRPPPAGE